MPKIPDRKSSETVEVLRSEDGKVCRKCKQWRVLIEYRNQYDKRHSRITVHTVCINCDKETSREYRKSGRGKYTLNKKYDDGYNYRYIKDKLRIGRLFASKIGYIPCTAFAGDLSLTFTTICNVCNKDVGRSKICLDHCHITGRFRGWLCLKCNSALGYAEDSVDRLKLLISYLEEHTDATHSDKEGTV